MTQDYLGQIADTDAEDGEDLADRLNKFDLAHKSNQLGTTRPAGIADGGIWSKDNGDGTRSLMLYDGASDHELVFASAIQQLFTTITDQTGSRAHSTSYQNTSGKPIMVLIEGRSTSASNNRDVETSTDNSTWTRATSLKSTATGNDNSRTSFIVPDGSYYRVNGNATISNWVEVT